MTVTTATSPITPYTYKKPKDSTVTPKNSEEIASLGKEANIASGGQEKANSRFDLLAHSQRLMQKHNVRNTKDGVHRTRKCHAVRAYNAESIEIMLTVDEKDSRAVLGGVQTCGSVWSCPVCAPRIAMERAKEISKAIAWAEKEGYIPIMITLTARHDRSMTLNGFKTAFKAAWRTFGAHRQYKTLKKELSIKHTIKAIEPLFGDNGWHYHQHGVLFVPAELLMKAEESECLANWKTRLSQLWLDCLGLHGLSGVGEYACKITTHGKPGEHYLAKMGLSDDDTGSNTRHELTGALNKSGQGLSVWGLLKRSYEHGDKLAENRYIEYVSAMQGDNWITWSRGFKKLVGIGEVEDEQASSDILNEQVVYESWMDLTDDEYAPVRKLKKYRQLLSIAARTRDQNAVRTFLYQLAGEADKTLDKRIEILRTQYSRACADFEMQRRLFHKTQSEGLLEFVFARDKERKQLKFELANLGEFV